MNTYNLKFKGSEINNALYTSSAYVTPQAFGAVGDGKHDDTMAIQAAINSNKPVFLPPGQYLVSKKLWTVPYGNITGCGNTSIIVCDSAEDLFMVAYANHISNLKITFTKRAENEPGIQIPMSGSIFKINEDSLKTSSKTNTCDIRTYISDILIEGNGYFKTDGHLSVFETSLKTTWGKDSNNQAGGIYGLNVSNIDAMFVAGSQVGYFYRSYAANKTYVDSQGKTKKLWITGVQFSNCNLIGERWGFFMGQDDEHIFDDELIGQCDLTAYNVQHQKTDENCIGFLFQRSGTKVSLYGCIPWDWNQRGSKSTHCPYIIDNQICSNDASWIENNRGRITDYKLLKADNMIEEGYQLTSSDYGLYYSIVKQQFRPDFFQRVQALRGPNNEPVTLLANITVRKTQDKKIITFEYQYLQNIAQCSLYLKPSAGKDNILYDFSTNITLPQDAKFYYTLEDHPTKDNYWEFKLYHEAQSSDWSVAAVVKEDCFTNSIAHFSGSGCQFADYLATVNGLNYNQYMSINDFNLEVPPNTRNEIFPNTSAIGFPIPTVADNNKILTVINGRPAWIALQKAEEVPL